MRIRRFVAPALLVGLVLLPAQTALAHEGEEELPARTLVKQAIALHLHGHTFQVLNGSGQGPRKDTVIVPPMGRPPPWVVAPVTFPPRRGSRSASPGSVATA